MAIKFTTAVKADMALVGEEAFSPYKSRIDAIGALIAEAEEQENALSAAARERIKKAAALRKQVGTLMKELAQDVTAYYDEEKSDDLELTEEGEKFRAVFGKRGTERSVKDMGIVEALMEEQKKGLFLELAKINLGDLDKYLTPEELETALDSKRTVRSLKIEEKP